MKTFYVDFDGYCEIEAETAEEAEEKFWAFIQNEQPLPQSIYDANCIEEKEEWKDETASLWMKSLISLSPL